MVSAAVMNSFLSPDNVLEVQKSKSIKSPYNHEAGLMALEHCARILSIHGDRAGISEKLYLFE